MNKRLRKRQEGKAGGKGRKEKRQGTKDWLNGAV